MDEAELENYHSEPHHDHIKMKYDKTTSSSAEAKEDLSLDEFEET